jgi:hypothetical protein
MDSRRCAYVRNWIDAGYRDRGVFGVTTDKSRKHDLLHPAGNGYRVTPTNRPERATGESLMNITAEQLKSELAALEQQKESLRNSYFQAEGACQALRQLINLAETPEPEPATETPTEPAEVALADGQAKTD